MSMYAIKYKATIIAILIKTTMLGYLDAGSGGGLLFWESLVCEWFGIIYDDTSSEREAH